MVSAWAIATALELEESFVEKVLQESKKENN